MENIKLSSFSELSTEEMYAVDGGLGPMLGPVIYPVIIKVISKWLTRK